MPARKLTDLFSTEAAELLESTGLDMVRRIGLDTTRGVVLDVMSGRNIRDSTEALTRTRIAKLNLAIVEFFLRGEAEMSGFAERLPYIAAENLQQSRLSKSERWLNYWALGLTNKGFQNILRDSVESIEDYRDEYVETCEKVISDFEGTLGQATGEIKLSAELRAEVSWLLLVYMMNMAGSQTLAIRGSDKSLNGKLFEKLILGSLLHSLGFSYTSEGSPSGLENVYWLSSRGERRESDATLLLRPGQAIRFDIGFIGRGNPEISLDKVTRFTREIELAGRHYYVSTIIIVDRIGHGSRIENLAREVEGHIVQMSEGYWPQKVARLLKREFDYDSALAELDQSEVRRYLKDRLVTSPLETFLGYEPD